MPVDPTKLYALAWDKPGLLTNALRYGWDRLETTDPSKLGPWILEVSTWAIGMADRALQGWESSTNAARLSAVKPLFDSLSKRRDKLRNLEAAFKAKPTLARARAWQQAVMPADGRPGIVDAMAAESHALAKGLEEDAPWWEFPALNSAIVGLFVLPLYNALESAQPGAGDAWAKGLEQASDVLTDPNAVPLPAWDDLPTFGSVGRGLAIAGGIGLGMWLLFGGRRGSA